MKLPVFIVGFVISLASFGQTLGGRSAYNFLMLPVSPVQTASGGINVSLQGQDAGFSLQNPALLVPAMKAQAATAFSHLPGGISGYSLGAAGLLPQHNTTVAGSVFFLDYGSIPGTDAAGNQTGSFRPVDFVVQASASRTYLRNWHYGLSAKFISSSYLQYKSQAVAFDAGILYNDSAALFSAGVVAKNMGFQIKTYGGEAEDLPFDLQAGFTKKLSDAPFGFSVTAHHLHRFDLTYNDSQFNADNAFASNATTFNKLFNHFIFASHVFIGDHLEATVGYNHLRRSELNVPDAENGLNGFSAGLRVKFSKLEIMYARAAYQKNIAYNHFGLNIRMDKLGIGR